jgi:hypothetical protein
MVSVAAAVVRMSCTGLNGALMARLDAIWKKLNISALNRIEGAAKYTAFTSTALVSMMHDCALTPASV